jgi:squalene cyclase
MELMDRETITKAIDWIHSVQRPDGSWYGSWYVPSPLEAEAEEEK